MTPELLFEITVTENHNLPETMLHTIMISNKQSFEYTSILIIPDGQVSVANQKSI